MLPIPRLIERRYLINKNPSGRDERRERKISTLSYRGAEKVGQGNRRDGASVIE
jgi:hypothetical protein